MQDNLIYKDNNYKGFVGVAELDVTPPIGIYSRNWGAALHNQSIGNHNSLKISCVTISQKANSTPLVLISLDACVWRSYELKERILGNIRREFSLPKENLAFCLTHTHAGPVLSEELDEEVGGNLNRYYIQVLEAHISNVITESLKNRSLSVITWKYGKCSLAKNRDLFLEDDNKFITGFNPANSSDDTLLVGRIVDVKTKYIKGIIVNYACHPTTLAWTNKLVSADYVGEMRDFINCEFECPILFVQGASGDLAPQIQYTDDLHIVKSNGKILAYSILSILEQMLPIEEEMYLKNIVASGADLANWDLARSSSNSTLTAHILPIVYRLKDMPSLEEISKQMQSEASRVEKEKLFRLKNLRIQFGNSDSVTIGVCVWQIGDALFVGQQNEAYSDFQLVLRSFFSAKSIIVGNIVNGSAGYLPPKELYTQDCYTVKQTPFAAGCLENLIQHTLSFINNLKSN
ncbi:MAG: neutral/alkaline non-lysosomal ceramidase N-terminal domain-containing protein [Sphingobacterium composti]|uniref:neutral/alkaline non-lysosomal ceramidase N-terminal domain-containing protein n=1 Tax=Sphingobacterium composti TaxID=363260 RepID=UPI00135BEAF9|nr:neutral/alkaline non-lysosomal ceramidase N-terminal domain-containing protein [Sphingobacterium composti Ten et al. 2007 non Yoo et al. 2007]